MVAVQENILIKKIPPVRGSLQCDYPISQSTWFRVGGNAQILFEPADAEDLSEFLFRLDENIPLTVIGAASNLLVRDGGIPGVTIRLGKPFSGVCRQKNSFEVIASGSAIGVKVSRAAQKSGISGLEFLSGIPGTVGGAIRMNAGAFGSEISEVLTQAKAVSRQGEILTFGRDEMDFDYRHNGCPDDLIFISAIISGRSEDPDLIAERMLEVNSARSVSQPIKARTGGSTFKNPPNSKAWQLIDSAGCRGLMRGQAQVSPQHCNFLINHGRASASDLEELGEEVRKRVFIKHGIDLEWEIKRVGLKDLASTEHEQHI